jgi:RHS repeat-associated protein
MLGRSGNFADANATYKYSGKELDEESGVNWYYFGARYYRSKARIGRWTSMDPLSVKAQDMTPYHYTHNNPINRIDMDGLSDLNFNRESGILTLTSSSAKVLGSWKASNNVQRSNPKGEWAAGTYKYVWTSDHTGEGASGKFGNVATFIFEVPGRSDMGVHGGREGVTDKAGHTGVDHATNGCIRTTDEAIQTILDTVNDGDPLKTITVIDKSNKSNSNNNKKNKDDSNSKKETTTTKTKSSSKKSAYTDTMRDLLGL